MKLADHLFIVCIIFAIIVMVMGIIGHNSKADLESYKQCSTDLNTCAINCLNIGGEDNCYPGCIVYHQGCELEMGVEDGN